MAKVKIRTKNPNRFGKKLIFPSGKHKVNKDGVVKLEEEEAAMMVESGGGWDFADSDDAPDDVEEEESEESEEEESDADADAEQREKQHAHLMEMDMDDLREMCSENNLPEKDWKGFKGVKGKPSLANYILDNLEIEID